jgi:hypothetical protein
MSQQNSPLIFFYTKKLTKYKQFFGKKVKYLKIRHSKKD